MQLSFIDIQAFQSRTFNYTFTTSKLDLWWIIRNTCAFLVVYPTYETVIFKPLRIQNFGEKSSGDFGDALELGMEVRSGTP
eukprot:72060-Amphidinium_carterae.1